MMNECLSVLKLDLMIFIRFVPLFPDLKTLKKYILSVTLSPAMKFDFFYAILKKGDDEIIKAYATAFICCI